MKEQFVRTGMLLGEAALKQLEKKRVAVFGIGGVGGYVAEALVRSGIGAIDLIDNDTVCLSNLNRQIIATHQSVGRLKTQVMEERIKSIHPECKVTRFDCFYLPEKGSEFPFSEYDYIVDAIDTVTAKLDLVVKAKQFQVPIISCMGTGNKLHPELLELADISQTSVCPLAKVMRKELRQRGIEHLQVVYSKEKPLTPHEIGQNEEKEADSGNKRRATPGSTSFVPGTAGLIIAGKVIRDLVQTGNCETAM